MGITLSVKNSKNRSTWLSQDDALISGRSPLGRSVAAPVYVTDLGIRRFEDPRQFYEAHVRNAGIERLTHEDLTGFLSGMAVNSLGSAIDAVVLFSVTMRRFMKLLVLG